MPESLSISGNIDPMTVSTNTKGTTSIGAQDKTTTTTDSTTAVNTPKEICALKLAITYFFGISI